MQAEVVRCHDQSVEAAVGFVALSHNGKGSYACVSVVGFGNSIFVNSVESGVGEATAIWVEPLPGDRIRRLNQEADQALASHNESKSEIALPVVNDLCPESSGFSDLIIPRAFFGESL